MRVGEWATVGKKIISWIYYLEPNSPMVHSKWWKEDLNNKLEKSTEKPQL